MAHNTRYKFRQSLGMASHQHNLCPAPCQCLGCPLSHHAITDHHRALTDLQCGSSAAVVTYLGQNQACKGRWVNALGKLPNLVTRADRWRKLPSRWGKHAIHVAHCSKDRFAYLEI